MKQPEDWQKQQDAYKQQVIGAQQPGLPGGI